MQDVREYRLSLRPEVLNYGIRSTRRLPKCDGHREFLVLRVQTDQTVKYPCGLVVAHELTPSFCDQLRGTWSDLHSGDARMHAPTIASADPEYVQYSRKTSFVAIQVEGSGRLVSSSAKRRSKSAATLRAWDPCLPLRAHRAVFNQTGAVADLGDVARSTLASNRFMVLGTVDPSGRPRVSPVWFSLVDYEVVYWLSSPDAQHSRNIEVRPEVSIVVFDSSAAPHTGRAVYLEATASRVLDDELADRCATAFRDVDAEFSHTPESLAGEPFVLYQADITASEIHVRGSDFGDGTGADQRVPVQLAR